MHGPANTTKKKPPPQGAAHATSDASVPVEREAEDTIGRQMRVAVKLDVIHSKYLSAPIPEVFGSFERLCGRMIFELGVAELLAHLDCLIVPVLPAVFAIQTDADVDDLLHGAAGRFSKLWAHVRRFIGVVRGAATAARQLAARRS